MELLESQKSCFSVFPVLKGQIGMDFEPAKIYTRKVAGALGASPLDPIRRLTPPDQQSASWTPAALGVRTHHVLT